MTACGGGQTDRETELGLRQAAQHSLRRAVHGQVLQLQEHLGEVPAFGPAFPEDIASPEIWGREVGGNGEEKPAVPSST